MNKKDSVLKTIALIFGSFYVVNVILNAMGGGGLWAFIDSVRMFINIGGYEWSLWVSPVKSFLYIFSQQEVPSEIYYAMLVKQTLLETSPLFIGVILIAVHMAFRGRWMVVLSFLGFTLWVFSALLIGAHC